MAKTGHLTVRIEPGLKASAAVAARQLGMTLGSVVELACRSVIAKAGRARQLEAQEAKTLQAALDRQQELEWKAKNARGVVMSPAERVEAKKRIERLQAREGRS